MRYNVFKITVSIRRNAHTQLDLQRARNRKGRNKADAYKDVFFFILKCVHAIQRSDILCVKSALSSTNFIGSKKKKNQI